MPGNISTALVYVVNALTTLFVLVFLLRLIMPWFGVDFRNPIAQAIMRISSPLVVPVRRIIPPFGTFDTATALVALTIQSLAVALMLIIYGIVGSPLLVIATAAVKLLGLGIMVFVYAIVIRVVISLLSPGTYYPLTAFVETLAEPILRPFRRLGLVVGGFDLSPIFAIVGLIALTIILRGAQFYAL